MFTLRADQVALLARNFNAGQLLDGFQKLGLNGVWEEGSDEIQFLDPRGHASRIKLDEHGRIAETLSPTGQRQEFAYDALHRLVGYRSPTGSVLRWDYDQEDRPTSLMRNESQRWLLESDEAGDLTAVVYPDGTSSRMAYQGLGKLVAYKDRVDAVTYFERDSLLRLTGMVNAQGARTQYSYTKWDRPDRILYPDGTSEEHARDDRGQLISAAVNGAPWAQIAWDDASRIKRIDNGDGHFVEFSYDSSGQVTEARNPNSTVTRKYDGNGRLVEENQNGEIVRFAYDAAGLLTSITDAKGESVKFTYDPDGRLAAIEDWSGKKHTVEYEHSGRTIRQRFASGVVTEIRAGALDRTESITTQSPQGFAFGLRYHHNINAQVARLDDSEFGYKVYQYDREGRTAKVTHERGDIEEFAYDANGNTHGAKPSTYNAADQILTHGQDQMSYDPRGNLVQVAGPNGPKDKTQYFYNGQNLLLVADLPHHRIEFRYDAFGRRISKTVNNVYTRYIWAGDQLLCEVTEEGSHETRCDYLFVPGTHIPFALRRDGRVCYYHTDALGTPRWLTDRSGLVVWSADYLAFGTARMRTEYVAQPFRFPGHYYDQETGLHYNRVRYYSPTLGRYLSRDPLDLASGLNFYTYANNDPINEADPLGLLGGWAKVALGIGIAVIGAAVVVAAAPAIIAVAAGAAVTAATVGAAVAVVAGGAAIGAGIALFLSPDGCLQCQVKNMIGGAGAGMMAAMMVLTLPFIGPAAGAFALAGGGTLAAGAAMTATQLSIDVIGASAVTGIVSMMASGGGGGGTSQDSGAEDKPSSKRPQRVEENQAKQDDLVRNQQKELKEAIEKGGAEEKGRVLNQQGQEAQAITHDTLEQVPGAKVKPDVNIVDGEGGQIDNVVTKGDKTVYVETKLTISDVNQRTISQLTNAVNAAQPGDSVILQVARQPTAAELQNLEQALGDNVYSKVQVVSSQTDLFDAVTSVLK